MSSPSVSFRITRSTEDLASTIHLLSQRLVRLEQRLAAMELQLTNQGKADPLELESLNHVERLLGDCRDLLALELAAPVALDSVEDAVAVEAAAEGAVDPAVRRAPEAFATEEDVFVDTMEPLEMANDEDESFPGDDEDQLDALAA